MTALSARSPRPLAALLALPVVLPLGLACGESASDAGSGAQASPSQSDPGSRQDPVPEAPRGDGSDVSVPAGDPSDSAGASPKDDPLDQWGQWRGPLATGEAPRATPPLEWSEDHNVRWKTALPGLGHSTPVVWGDRIYVTAAEAHGDVLPPLPETAPGAHDNLSVTQRHRFYVIALDRANGEVLWQRELHEALPHEGGHVSGSLASASPVTNGELVVAFFGSYGLYALTPDGDPVWDVDLGPMQSKHGHGEGASPLLVDDTVVVNWDHEGPSFLAAFDLWTGDLRWRAERDEVTSWATPIAVRDGDRTQVVVSGTTALRGYDLASGDVIWECGGLSRNVVASPVFADGVVIAGSSYEKQAMIAIELDGAEGDLTRSDELLWVRRRGCPYVPSPLLVDGSVYFLHHYQPLLARVDVRSGTEPTGPFRLGGIENVYASPVSAAGRVYLTDLGGRTLVFTTDPVPEILQLNELDEPISASAALAGDELYLRGRTSLYCIAES